MTKDWITNLFSVTDRMDADGFRGFLTEKCVFRFGNAPLVYGKENIRDYVNNFFSSIKGLSHRILDTWEFNLKETVICEGEVTYTRRDDKKITLLFVDIFRMEEGLIADYRVYIDISPLYA